MVDLNADDREELVVAYDRYLQSLHTAGWGQFFSVTSEVDRRKAAEWAADHMLRMIDLQEQETHG